MRHGGRRLVAIIFISAALAPARAEEKPVQMDCSVCSGASILRRPEDLMATHETPEEWACLDSGLASTLVNWINKRDTSESMKFAPFSHRMNVTVDIDIRSMWEINQKAQEYKLKFQISMTWKSCPMVFNGDYATKGKGVLLLAGEQDFWNPVLDYSSIHKEEKHATDDQSYWVIKSDGTVTFSQVKIGTYACSFDFTDLPNDVQTCTLKMTPLKEPSDYLRLEAGSLSLPEGGLTNAQWGISDFTFGRQDVEKVVSGFDFTFSQLTVQFKLTRNPAFYSISVVAPTVVIWGLSYAGLFIPMTALPARAALAAIPVLIVINTQTRVLSGLPPISYFTWLDRFLMVVQILLLAHMTEYALVAYCIAAAAKMEKQKAGTKKTDAVVPAAFAEDADKAEAEPPSWRYVITKWIAENFESYFRIVALLVFLITLTVHSFAV
eukprot:TRINITY_DN81564_c0_g1_i1.p1 TRINITY_DN81564_c0_g1~~TRINITY_DN81564_c0_g1_i1.p1  ORF type:complete len:437 (-),score=76.52 TRINITY_DN81564_c0_g1_i1:218-1528(-)